MPSSLIEAPASDLLRVATAGSVDDGKSSLIGRLLYDSKAILEDQLSAIEHASRQRGNGYLELALLTDGLRAEREQNITIDVAYRYFSTPRRKFIIADTPGHVQYTRNMVTGTSTSDVSVILVDARKGVLTQSRRHAAISTLLGVRHLLIAVNKMDLVDFEEAVFRNIEAEFLAFLDRLGGPATTFIPISALLGDNVVQASERTPWYDGPPLLEFLEQLELPARDGTDFRLPIQYVVRPHQDFRGFAGQIEGGSVGVGEQVVVSRTGIKSRVRSIHVAGAREDRASVGQPAVIELDDEVDVSRGDLLASATGGPTSSERVEAIVCWFHETPLEVGRRYVLLHTTRRVPAVIEAVLHRVDADTLNSMASTELGMNDIGSVVVHAASPLFFDAYRQNPATGSFVLVDPGTNSTVGAGMIQRVRGEATRSWHRAGRIIWLDNWSDRGAGLAQELRHTGHPVVVLDGALLAGEDVSGLGRIASSIGAQGFDVLIARALGEREFHADSDLGERLHATVDPMIQITRLLGPRGRSAEGYDASDYEI